MSCQMNAFGCIVDLDSVKKCLYVNGLASGNTSIQSLSRQERDPQWLDECGLSLSPSGELLALIYRQNLVILSAKWDNSEESTPKIKYHMVWHGDPCQEHNETITSVCVLPLAAPQNQKSLSHSVPDWTCIALGFSSGALRFYTDKGDLLLSEVLHDGPVTSIKCQTTSPARYTGQPELTEELHVSYRAVLCSIYGFVLVNTLRACRNQLARVQANCSDTVVAPPLSLHKWSLPDQDSVVDCAVGLPQCPSAFTHLHIASVCGGFSTGYRPSPPQSSLVVAAGNKPFVGFHYIVEGSNTPVLTDVVKAVGTKLKSAINQSVPTWFWGGKKSTPVSEKEKIIIEPPEPMSCRFGLCDLWRQGLTVTMSPQRNMCAVTDTLGRVILVDNSTGIALRMWKGYRDAQCGWLTAEEEVKGMKRSALFHVIYAPKKGVIEVWAMQQGPRVATFTTSKNGRLFYISHGLLGISPLRNKSPNRSTTPCVFIDESGVLTEISVPFHCALSDKNSARARDIHLVRKLRQSLKEEQSDSVVSACRQLQTCVGRSQALDVLVASRRVTALTMLEIVEGFLHALEDKEDENADTSRNTLLQRCLKLQKLLIFFHFCSGLHQKPPDYDTVVKSETNDDLDSLSEFLRMSKEDTQKLLQLKNESPETVRVKFQEGSTGLTAYLAGFVSDSNSEDTICLVEPVKNENLIHISETVCGSLEGNISTWCSAAADSSIDSFALLRLTLVSWLNKRTPPSISDTLTLGQLVSAICNIAGDRVQDPEWWEEVRSLLRESIQPHLAVIATAVCKAVAITFEETAVMTGSAGTDDSECKTNDWEKVTPWSLLINQMEDLALINSVLRQKPYCSTTPPLHCLPYDPPELSLQNVSSKGKGCISELVAKWVGSCGMDPTLLLENTPGELQSGGISQGKGEGFGVVEGSPLAGETAQEARPLSQAEQTTLSNLHTLRQQFPYSLSERALLTNLAWEYVLAWSRQVDNLHSLQSAIACVRALPSARLTQGVCTLLWGMHLKSRFESALRLINKIGKVPKERLCRQDIGLSELQIGDFFSICSDFLEVFMESRALSEECSDEKVSYEDLWESSPVPPLQELALKQPTANYDLLLLLSQCVRSLQLLSVFSLRTPRLLNTLFDSIGQNALFADITAHIQLPSHVHDQALSESRTHFLLRAVTAAAATITRHDQEYNMTACLECMKQCLLLASDWSLSADPLRRRQCCELYARGYDRLAEEVLVSVNETTALGNQLLTVAGHRVKLFMAQSHTQLKEQVTHMSPALSSWINSLGDGTVEQSTLADTLELVVVASSLLEEEGESKRIAAMLLDSLAPVVNKEQSSDR